jgi:hypothetical protein
MASLPKPIGLHVLEDITGEDDGFSVKELSLEDLSDQGTYSPHPDPPARQLEVAIPVADIL